VLPLADIDIGGNPSARRLPDDAAAKLVTNPSAARTEISAVASLRLDIPPASFFIEG